jgi:hypothetical protein
MKGIGSFNNDGRSNFREARKRRIRQLRDFVLGCLAIAVIVLVVWGIVWGVSSGISVLRQDPKIKSLAAHLEEYISNSNLVPLSQGEKPYIKGKIVPVDTAHNRIDEDMYFSLPVDIVAQTPGDVGTVLCLKKDSVLWGYYQIGGSRKGEGYQIVCDVTIIDRVNNVIVAKRTFKGSQPPPVNTSGSVTLYGSDPTVEIINYLKSLPLR